MTTHISKAMIEASAIDADKIDAAKQGYAPGHFEHGVAPGLASGTLTAKATRLL